MPTMFFSSSEILFKFNFKSFSSQQNLAALPFEKLKVNREKISFQVHLCRKKSLAVEQMECIIYVKKKEKCFNFKVMANFSNK